jgi:hypothetical protein
VKDALRPLCQSNQATPNKQHSKQPIETDSRRFPMKNKTSFEVIEEAVNNSVDRINKVSDVKTYVESLDRPVTGQYVAMPDGTIQFIR